jgi:glycogen debranching enzyme
MSIKQDSLFDIDSVPFSRFGSWMSIAIPRGEEDIFFRNCHNGSHNVFPMQLLVDGAVVKPEITAQPGRLVLSHGEGTVEVCFESANTVRMRGRGVSMQFGNKHLIYSEAPNRAVINCREALRRYQIEMLQGNIELQQLVPTQPVYPVIAHVSPDEDGCWELAIDEFWSTWKRPARKSFEDALADTLADFTGFLDSMPQAREQDGRARELAAYINWAFTVEPCGLIKRPTLFMSKNWMCNVWSWDQCFNAMALAAGQPDLAMDQMLTLVDHQDEFGSYPDSVNDITIHFNFSKPPVHGWAFSEMLKSMPERPSRDVMETMYTSLSRQAEWWMENRCQVSGVSGQKETKLPYYLHGNDSGWDNSTMFMQGVPLIAPDLSALLVIQMDVLSDLAEELGLSSDWKARADALFELMMKELWREDHFVARLANSAADVESESLIPWLPMILGERLPVEVRDCLKAGMETHLTEWGLATEKVDSPKYQSNGYWQGPIWGPSTFIAVTGLARAGFDDLADDVSARFCRLCGKSGFAENYDAVTGASLCDPAYTWTASAFLLIAERLNERNIS